MTHGASDFQVGGFAEVATVMQAGQRVVDGQLVDLFVVTRLDAVLGDELQHALADGDAIAVGQQRILLDAGIVQAGGIGGTEIANAKSTGVVPEPAVLTGNALVFDDEVGILIAANEDGPVVDIDPLAKAFAVDHDHAGRTQCRLGRSCAEQGALGGVVVGRIAVHGRTRDVTAAV